MVRRKWISRRALLKGVLSAALLPVEVSAPWRSREASASSRILATHGVQSSLVDASTGLVWCRSNQLARMALEWSTTESFKRSTIVKGPQVGPETDFTGRMLLPRLPHGQSIFYRVVFDEVAGKGQSPPVLGQFRVPPLKRSALKILWGGDTAGQGFGSNLDWGGMRTYRTMELQDADLFIHSGDGIYADSPIPEKIDLPDGTVWRNRVAEAKGKVAETLDEFRGNWRYTLEDPMVQSFNARTPQFVQWDDHEVTNNWYPGKILTDPRYRVTNCDLLSSRGRQAFYEYTTVWRDPKDPLRIYTSLRVGPDIELFKLDARSYRGRNSRNDETTSSEATSFFGAAQMAWLKGALLRSSAKWKILLSDMPTSLIIEDGDDVYEGVAQGSIPPKGRELEIAELLRWMKRNAIKNTVWLTADVHYAAAHYFDPSQAQFKDFLPFWEFVAGPLNAICGSPKILDPTFGPVRKFCSAEGIGTSGAPPGPKTQFFGAVEVDGKTADLTVSLFNMGGEKLYSVRLEG